MRSLVQGLIYSIFIAFPFLFLYQQGYSQTPVYTNYTVNDGLPSHVVYCALQDNEGYIWFGTDAGVSRFDGIHFKNFTVKDGLSDNEVLKMFKDSKGRIWFFTLNGKLSYYYQNQIYNSSVDTQLGKVRARFEFMSFMEDSKGNLWFGGYGRQLVLIEKNGTIQNFNFDSLNINFRRAWIYTYERSSDEIWIFTPKHVFKYYNDKLSIMDTMNFLNPNYIYFNIENISAGCGFYFSKEGIYRLKNGKIDLLVSKEEIPEYNKVKHISIDQDKNIWLFTLDYKTIYLKGQETNYDLDQIYFKGIYIGDILIDNEKNKWFCTIGNGIYKVHSNSNLIDNFCNNDSLYKESITCISSDRKGGVWFGTALGNLYCLDKKKLWSTCINSNKDYKTSITHINFDLSENIWLATNTGVLYIEKEGGNYITPKSIDLEYGEKLKGKMFNTENLIFNKKNELFISTNSGLASLQEDIQDPYFTFLNPEIILPKRIYCLYFDKSDNLWFENFEQLFSYKNEQLTQYPDLYDNFHSEITDIKGFSDSILLITTYGDGVKLLKEGKVIADINTSMGLASDLCRKAYIDSDIIYVATNQGFSYFKYKNNKITDLKTFTTSDGILSNDIKDICAKGNKIYLATSSGLCVVDKKISQSVGTVPPVYITSISSSDSIFKKDDDIRLSYSSDFNINYIALTYEQPDKIIYQYNLNGNKKDWIETKTSSIAFSSLSPGNYRFQLRAKKYNSGWSSPVEIHFSIIPPFWQQWWFRLLILSVIISIGYYLLRLATGRRLRNELARLKQQQAIASERTRISSDMHDDLGADLSNLLLLSRMTGRFANLETEQKKQINRLESFAGGVIQKVDEIIWALNPSNDTLNGLIQFIDSYCKNIFQLSTKSGTVIIPEFIPDAFINAAFRRNIFLVVKEALNNIVNHSSANEISVHITIDNKQLKISINDDGVGFELDSKKMLGNGLMNMKKRIEELQGEFQIKSQKDEGSSILFKVPFL